ncbi:MAG: hypothetical protein KAT66_07895 [Candidatus Lokiarchaeota archaeon]|nr:hypothetical protein [Candidatus Lokiarchaeota archaeon]
MKKERLNKNFLADFKDYDFLKIKENKIYLVGSIRFREYFIKIESILQITHKKLVNICSVDGLLNKEKFADEEWEKLQEIALRKLHDQEAILVLDIDNYIGEQSREEIDYFKNNLKRSIYFLSELNLKLYKNQ